MLGYNLTNMLASFKLTVSALVGANYDLQCQV